MLAEQVAFQRLAHRGDRLAAVGSRKRRLATLVGGMTAGHRRSVDVRANDGRVFRADVDGHDGDARGPQPLGHERQLVSLGVHRGDGIDRLVHQRTPDRNFRRGFKVD